MDDGAIRRTRVLTSFLFFIKLVSTSPSLSNLPASLSVCDCVNKDLLLLRENRSNGECNCEFGAGT